VAAAFFAGAFFASSLVAALFAGAAFLAGAFLAGAFFAVALTVVRALEAAAATSFGDLVSSAETTTETPSSLRNLSTALRCCGVVATAAVAVRRASAVTVPVCLPCSTRATMSGWDRTSTGTLRDVLDDTNYLSYNGWWARRGPFTSRAAFLL